MIHADALFLTSPGRSVMEAVVAPGYLCHVYCHHPNPYLSRDLEESFGEMADYVYGIETGLSSDPDMNWQVSELKNRSILSFSAAHSPAKMGRESTVSVDKNGMTNDKLIAGSTDRTAISDPSQTVRGRRFHSSAERAISGRGTFRRAEQRVHRPPIGGFLEPSDERTKAL